MFSKCFPSVETYLGNSMFSKVFRLGRCMEYIMYSSQKDVFDEFLQKEYLINGYIMKICVGNVWKTHGIHKVSHKILHNVSISKVLFLQELIKNIMYFWLEYKMYSIHLPSLKTFGEH